MSEHRFGDPSSGVQYPDRSGAREWVMVVGIIVYYGDAVHIRGIMEHRVDGFR